MKTIRLAAAAVLAAATIAGCASAPGAQPGEGAGTLEGTQWRPLILEGSPAAVSSRAMLRFAEAGVLQGNDGCNAMGGKWSATANELSITLGLTTLMACPPPVDAASRSLLSALASTRGFAFDGSRLSLLGPDGAALAVLAPTEPASLLDSSWVVQSIHDAKQAVVSVPTGVTIRMRFGADGKVAGNAGCNDYNGSFIADGESLRLSPLRTTRKACPGEAMSQESRFLAAMERVETFRLGQRELDLFDAEGARLASLVSAP